MLRGSEIMNSERVRQEINYRKKLWMELISRGGTKNVSADTLRELGIYGGAQGVWLNKSRTKYLTDDGTGVTVSLLHKGNRYSDDLFEDGVLYHYPETNRGNKDNIEIEATKNAGRLGIPVFVISQSKEDPKKRDVNLGLVRDWDDNNKVFLIEFQDSFPENETSVLLENISEDEPFVPFEDTKNSSRLVSTRPNQYRFKFLVLKRYEGKCVICDLNVIELLQAAHIIPKRKRGTDDPRNGLLLCANHHLAFDAGLFAIEPNSLSIHFKPGGPDATALQISRKNLKHLKHKPHPESLKWRWREWKKLIRG